MNIVWYKNIDWLLIGAMVPLFLAGLVTMGGFGATSQIFDRQLIWIVIGSIFCGFIAFSDIRFLRDSRYVTLGYVIALSLLLLVLFVGKTVKGSQSWFTLGFFSFQPTDIVKLFVVLMCAKYFSRRHVEIARLRHLLISGLYALVPIVLILLQPDFGSAVVIIGLWFGLALVAGISKKHIFFVLGVATIAFLVGWFFLFKPYQKARIINFVNPTADIRGTGYNAYQSMIAVGSGGFWGKGVGYGTQSRLNFLPEYETDFIFAAFAEEWGMVGGIVVLACYVIILWRLLLHARLGATNFETLFCVGFALLLFAHIVVNVGMNLGVMPVTGIPLPFMSYGGSHIIAELIGIGMVLSMSRFERASHREDLNREFLYYGTVK